jgi:hypothetical protein
VGPDWTPTDSLVDGPPVGPFGVIRNALANANVGVDVMPALDPGTDVSRLSQIRVCAT